MSHLNEKLEVLPDVDEIQVPIEAEDVDAATGAAGVEDDGEGGGSFVADLAVREGVVIHGLAGGGGRHGVEHERDEEERHCHHQKCSPEVVDLVGERIRRWQQEPIGAFQHFGGFEIQLSGGEEFGGGRDFEESLKEEGFRLEVK